jgi:hypothetical protein
MNRAPSFLFVLICLVSTAIFAEERTFTDDQGRTIKAEPMGFRGENVVLKRNGQMIQWPVKKLSQNDQAFLAEWRTSAKANSVIQLQIWDKKGIGRKGVLNADKLSPYPGKNIPLLKEVEEKGDYRHYEIDVYNNSAVDEENLKVAYVLFVITPDRRVVGEKGEQLIELLGAGKRKTITTGGITYTRTKTTSTTISTGFFGRLQVGSKTDRSKETFGGAWVKVFNSDGAVIGEARDLIPQLENMNPQWDVPGTTQKPRNSLEELQKTLTGIKDALEDLKQ